MPFLSFCNLRYPNYKGNCIWGSQEQQFLTNFNNNLCKYMVMNGY